jgi:hypothetical protein
MNPPNDLLCRHCGKPVRQYWRMRSTYCNLPDILVFRCANLDCWLHLTEIDHDKYSTFDVAKTIATLQAEKQKWDARRAFKVKS